MKLQRAMHCWALLTVNSAYGGLNIFDTGGSPYKLISNMEHG